MVCACASWVGVPRCVMGAVAAGAAVDVAAALAPMPPLVPPPARLLTPPLVPLARARVISWGDYRSLSRWASPRPVAFPKQFGNYPARRRLRALWQRRWEGKQTALTACGCAPIRSLRRFLPSPFPVCDILGPRATLLWQKPTSGYGFLPLFEFRPAARGGFLSGRLRWPGKNPSRATG